MKTSASKRELVGIPDQYLVEKCIALKQNTKKSLIKDLNSIFDQVILFLNNRENYLNSHELEYLEQLVPDLGKTLNISHQSIVSRPDGVFLEDGTFKLFELNVSTSIGGTLIFHRLLDLYQRENKLLESPLIAQTKFLEKFSNENYISWRMFDNDKYYQEEIDISAQICKKINHTFKLLPDKEALKNIDTSCATFYRTISTAESNRIKDRIYQFEEEILSSGGKICLKGKISDALSSKTVFAFVSKYIGIEQLVWSRWLGNNNLNYKSSEQKKLISKVINDKDAYLIKRDSSYQGNHLAIGREISQLAWNKTVAEAVQEGNWVVQNIIESPKYEVKINSTKKGLHSIMSPYYYGGELGGIVARVRLDDKLSAILPGVTETAIGAFQLENE